MELIAVLLIVLSVSVKSSLGLRCYSCASSIDSRCQEQMGPFLDLQTECLPQVNFCTSVISTAVGFGTTVIRGCVASCSPQSITVGTQTQVRTCCSTDLCNLNTNSPSSPATTTTVPTPSSTTRSTATSSTIFTTTSTLPATVSVTTTRTTPRSTSNLLSQSGPSRFQIISLLPFMIISSSISFYLLE